MAKDANLELIAEALRTASPEKKKEFASMLRQAVRVAGDPLGRAARLLKIAEEEEESCQ